MTHMATGGYIKLHRKALSSAVFADATLWRVWTWMLLKANHKPDRFRGVEIPRGSFATGMKSAAEQLGMPQTTFYRSLKRIEKMGMCGTQVERGFTVVTIYKYETYQQEKPSRGKQVENKRNGGGTEAETREETKEPKEPPPPTPSGGFAGADRGDPRWMEVEEELYAAGLARAQDAVAMVRRNGCTPAQVREILRHYLERRPAYGVGALYRRLEILRVGQEPSDLWPQPSSESRDLERRQSSQAAIAKQELERKSVEQQQERARQERQELERECGPVLDAMSGGEIRELIAEKWPESQSFYLRKMPARGSPTGFLRDALLLAISESREAADSDLEHSRR